VWHGPFGPVTGALSLSVQVAFPEYRSTQLQGYVRVETGEVSPEASSS